MFWYWIAVIVISIVAYACMPRPKPPAIAAKAGQIEMTIAEEGGTIPVVYGTRILTSNNIGWYGDQSTTPVYQNSGGSK